VGRCPLAYHSPTTASYKTSEGYVVVYTIPHNTTAYQSVWGPGIQITFIVSTLLAASQSTTQFLFASLHSGCYNKLLIFLMWIKVQQQQLKCGALSAMHTSMIVIIQDRLLLVE